MKKTNKIGKEIKAKKAPLKFGKTPEQIKAFEQKVADDVAKFGRPMPAEVGAMYFEPGANAMTDIKKTSKLSGSVQGNLYDHNMSTHRNQAKKLRKSNFWNNVRAFFSMLADAIIIMFFIIWVSILLQYYGATQRHTGCDDRGNCYLTKA